MRMLVTGGAGFIGANVVHQTLRDRPEYEVVVLDALTCAGNEASLAPVRADVEFVKGSVADADLVDRLRCGGAFHRRVAQRQLAARPLAVLQTNIVGTFALLKAVRKHSVRYHHVSTDEVGSLDANLVVIVPPGRTRLPPRAAATHQRGRDPSRPRGTLYLAGSSSRLCAMRWLASNRRSSRTSDGDGGCAGHRRARRHS